jgi:hypothetical protein
LAKSLKRDERQIIADANQLDQSDPVERLEIGMQRHQKRRALVDAYCTAIGAYEPPQFIRELVKANHAKPSLLSRTSEKYWSTTEGMQELHDEGYKLISDPENVRKVASDTGIPVPFSMVLQAELEQIRETRNFVCETPHGPRMTSQLREPIIGEKASTGASIRQALREDLVG